jgi:hypothetical protein
LSCELASLFGELNAPLATIEPPTIANPTAPSPRALIDDAPENEDNFDCQGDVIGPDNLIEMLVDDDNESLAYLTDHARVELVRTFIQ